MARAVAALVAATWLLAMPAQAATKNVAATSGNKFSPGTVHIKPGDTVLWTNTGGVGHTVTSSSGDWSKDDAIAAPTNTTSYTFTKPGTYRYYCRVHGAPSSGMRGAVVVDAPSPSPSPTRTTTPPPTSNPPPTSAPPTSAPPTTSGPPPSGSPSATAVLPSGTPSTTTTPPPFPTVAPPVTPGPTGTPYLGVGGLTPYPPTGRGRGLPLLVALVLILGVGAGEVRAVRATEPY